MTVNPTRGLQPFENIKSNWEAGAGIREHLPGSRRSQGLPVPRWAVAACSATSARAGTNLGDASCKAHGQEGGWRETTAPSIPPDITTFTKRHATGNILPLAAAAVTNPLGESKAFLCQFITLWEAPKS